jgi:hypothetical protein
MPFRDSPSSGREIGVNGRVEIVRAHPPEYMTSDSRPISQDKPQDSRDEILKAGIRLFARPRVR